MMKGVLLGAGLGAGLGLMTGKDPLKYGMYGGLAGGLGSGLSTLGTAGATGGATTALQGSPHLVSGATFANPFSTGVASTLPEIGSFTPEILTNSTGATSGGLLSNFGDKVSNFFTSESPLDKAIGEGFDKVSGMYDKGLGILEDETGITSKDLNTLALTQGVDMATEPNPDNQIEHAQIQGKEANYPVNPEPFGNLNVLGPQEATTFGLGTDPKIIQGALYENPDHNLNSREDLIRKRRRIGGII